MPESRSKYSSANTEKRRGNIRNVLLGLLIGFAVLFVILAGRYAYGKSKDPNYSIRDLFGITTAAEIPTLPTLPINDLIPPDLSSAAGMTETAGTSTEETTPEATADTTAETETAEPTTEAPPETTPEETTPEETTQEETTPEETTPEETTPEETTPEETTPEETTPEETTPVETTEPPVIITDPTDINYHLKRYNMEESDLGKCKQLIVVQSSGTQCTLYFFEKGKDGWAPAEAIPSAPGVLGRNGVSTSKHEGDNCTPAGYYALGPCYGEDSTSPTAMEYHQITEGDYWIDDVNSKYYNTMVHEESFATRKGWETGEDMYELLHYYRYMAVIRYNTDPIVPGAGSAIFLHCQAGDTDTSGCVSTKEATMFAVLRWLDPDSDPHILIY